jgi:RNA polymerase sigma-70 factor (ECF subfamily)
VTSFSAWLFAVARRACLRLLRRAAGTADASVDDAEMRLVHLAPEDIRIDLSRAIQSLPDHYREVILLRDIEELSIDEIAGVLALTRESVKARIHRARLMIREYLIRD